MAFDVFFVCDSTQIRISSKPLKALAMKSSPLFSSLLAAGMAFMIAGCSRTQGRSDRVVEPINVEVQQSVIADGSRAFAYSGTIEESESVPLSFAVVGTVSRVVVSEGDYVKKGQPLAFLNDESYRNAFDMSEATRRQAEDAFKRLQPMYKNGTLPEVKYVEIESDLQRARAAATIAKKNLDDCVLVTPVAGIVGRRSVEPGMSALPNIASITIVNIQKVYARVSVSENEIAAMRKGQRAVVRISALNGMSVWGTVEEIGVLADPLSHTYTVRIAIPNPKREIKPGMICAVRIERPAATQSVVIAGHAVMVDESGRSFVYAVDTAAGMAVRRYVVPGSLVNGGIEVMDGLAAQEMVVVAGQHKLVDSSAVRIVSVRPSELPVP